LPYLVFTFEPIFLGNIFLVLDNYEAEVISIMTWCYLLPCKLLVCREFKKQIDQKMDFTFDQESQSYWRRQQ